MPLPLLQPRPDPASSGLAARIAITMSEGSRGKSEVQPGRLGVTKINSQGRSEGRSGSLGSMGRSEQLSSSATSQAGRSEPLGQCDPGPPQKSEGGPPPPIYVEPLTHPKTSGTVLSTETPRQPSVTGNAARTAQSVSGANGGDGGKAAAGLAPPPPGFNTFTFNTGPEGGMKLWWVPGQCCTLCSWRVEIRWRGVCSRRGELLVSFGGPGVASYVGLCVFRV